MSKNQVKRIIRNGQCFVCKTSHSKGELLAHQHFLQQQLRVPALFDVEERADGSVTLLMEDLGSEHLEMHPELYEQAFACLLRLRAVPCHTDVHPITTDRLLQQLQQGPSWQAVGQALGFEQARIDRLQGVFAWVHREGTYGEPLVFSHGDAHPKNWLVLSGQVIPIDFEKTGAHSVFQDLYALLHMAYPERRSCLTAQQQDKLFQQFFTALGLQGQQAGYETFRLLNRLQELVQISDDLQNGRRHAAGLLAQAESVYDDLLLRYC